jgi:hypothetical protein
MVTVVFTDKKERQFDADGGGPSGPLFVLWKYNPKRRKREICQQFPLETVVRVHTAETIIVGGGRMEGVDP